MFKGFEKMVKSKKIIITTSLISMMMFLVIALWVMQQNMYATTSTLSSLPVGTKIMFSGRIFQVVKPAEGFVVSTKTIMGKAFDPNATQVYDTSVLNNNNIGYYLNNDYYNTFSGVEQALIKDSIWYIGNETNETASSVTAKIGLLRESEYTAVRGTSSPAEAGKIFPSGGGLDYWWTITPSSADAERVRTVYNDGNVLGGLVYNPFGVRPALRILESTIFTKSNKSEIYY